MSPSGDGHEFGVVVERLKSSSFRAHDPNSVRLRRLAQGLRARRGGGWPDHRFAGGETYRAGAEIAQVELRFANGVMLGDDADADIALIISESTVQLPSTAVLLDPAGNKIRRETARR